MVEGIHSNTEIENAYQPQNVNCEHFSLLLMDQEMLR